MVVKDVLKNLGIRYLSINLGQVELFEDIPNVQLEQIRAGLRQSGLELMDDKKSVLIEKIKDIIIEMVHYEEELPKVNFSDYLTEKLNYNYTYLANLFSETEGITIEHFIIIHKIERVKELIIYDELNLTEIAWKLHYSSVAHLSHQFKKVTGLTPTFFKALKNKKRNNLENL
jgi:AraC-type DNA-binding domain-containing proteins